MERFPIPTVLGPGESLPGYISRICMLHDYPGMAAMLDVTGISNDHDRESSSNLNRLMAGGDLLKPLANLSQMPLETLQRAVLQSAPFPWESFTDLHRVFIHWRHCPDCTAAGTPHQAIWQVPWMTACPVHRQPLVETCDVCNRPVLMSKLFEPRCGKCANEKQAVTRELATVSESEVAFCAALVATRETDPKSFRRHIAWASALMHLLDPMILMLNARITPQGLSVSAMRARLQQIWPVLQCPNERARWIARYRLARLQRWPGLDGIDRLPLTVRFACSGVDCDPVAKSVLDELKAYFAAAIASDIAPLRGAGPLQSGLSHCAPLLSASVVNLRMMIEKGLVARAVTRDRTKTTPSIEFDALQDLINRLGEQCGVVPEQTDAPDWIALIAAQSDVGAAGSPGLGKVCWRSLKVDQRIASRNSVTGCLT